ncbi:unnamed protein product [Microthlaspi erraticum]|uniref:Uncharacterized protein n=1 Tax=Microthlaspi erraticum TaxID=1685480 RepID=A0A6D2HTH5_9BRAS|nr:unnamed protein product [Microthlaspi erraticum]
MPSPIKRASAEPDCFISSSDSIIRVDSVSRRIAAELSSDEASRSGTEMVDSPCTEASGSHCAEPVSSEAGPVSPRVGNDTDDEETCGDELSGSLN